jgi:hypothetical protein
MGTTTIVGTNVLRRRPEWLSLAAIDAIPSSGGARKKAKHSAIRPVTVWTDIVEEDVPE